VRFAFAYWPPGWSIAPHEHTAWTITAVCRNELEVLTFDRDASYRRQELVTKNRFQAAAGRVGFIYDPSIHQPRNCSADWSVSFHVSSPRDGEPVGDYAEGIPGLAVWDRSRPEDAHPYMRVVATRRRQSYLLQLARILASMTVPRAPQLLAECIELASTPTRRAISGMLGPAGSGSYLDAPWMFVRAHADLVHKYRCTGGKTHLDAETWQEPVEQFAVPSRFSEAIAFVVNASRFDLRSLPGRLTDDEKIAIGEALETSGLFMRIASHSNDPPCDSNSAA